ncbi:MAG: cysteine desulfurase [Treponema sp.]|nr:cysteine desulfurase [Treponema sp.]
MINKEHYFDWAATAVPDEEILKKALDYSTTHWGNPSSIHEAGSDAKKALEEVRSKCAYALGVESSKIYFTSGGTEGDHLPLLSILSRPQKGSVLVSAIEHSALTQMAKMIQNCGWRVITVNPNKDGIITPQAIEEKLEDDTTFVTVMAVNNETGAIQKIKEIAELLLKKAGGKRKPFFHVDCVQAAGKIPFDLNTPGIDSASFSAHKIGGPRGIGILYLAKEFTSFLRGGGQEKNIRSGTENLFGAAAFSYALEKYFISSKNTESTNRFEQQKKMTLNFIEELKSIKGCVLIPHCRSDNSTEENFSPWIVQAAFPGIPGQVMVRALSSEGFCISTGSACSAGSHARPILDTMQIPAKEKESAVRFSFGHETTEKGMKDLIEKLREITEKFL